MWPNQWHKKNLSNKELSTLTSPRINKLKRLESKIKKNKAKDCYMYEQMTEYLTC